MFLAAFASLSNPESREYYDKKRVEGKKHNAALICLARRRSDVTHAMLRDRKPYPLAYCGISPTSTNRRLGGGRAPTVCREMVT